MRRDPITHELIVKRIVALAGDIVKTLPPYPDVEIQVPEGHAWVEGISQFCPHCARTLIRRMRQATNHSRVETVIDSDL
jgi:signal peptidase I